MALPTAWLMPYPEILLALACFILLSLFCSSRSGRLPYNWPVLGMLPAIISNFTHIHDYITHFLRESGCTFGFRGPWFLNMDFLITSDPANVNHVINVNFSNYPKGRKFAEIFDILGDGILNSDSDSWRSQRKLAQSILSGGEVRSALAKISRDKVEMGLIPILDYMASEYKVVDMQDLFNRFAFDTTCNIVHGVDPGSLSLEFPAVPFTKAIDNAQGALLLRHLMPKCVWKAMRWLKIGREKRLGSACQQIDCFIFEQIARCREMKTGSHDLISLYMKRDIDDEKFLRDTALTFMIAGRDTISLALAWFFYLVSINPTVESKIVNQLISIQANETRKSTMFDAVYLHAALCESLRLYPPIPFELKGVLKTDVLPSGHTVTPQSKVLISIYAMARMEGIWGKDCMEFKPERWISENGKLRHEPSYKFLAFNCGPRTCLGKEIALTQLKIVAAAIIYNFHVELLVGGHDVMPKSSMALTMKNGMMARIRRRAII